MDRIDETHKMLPRAAFPGQAVVHDSEERKLLKSPGYNFLFRKSDGMFFRWGATLEEDPPMSPYGPELVDIEISSGDCSGGCPWCYKSNETGAGVHMSLQTYDEILSKLPPTVMQIALGITDVDANPHFEDILMASGEADIVPNFTTSGIGFDKAPWLMQRCAELAGAIAVSVYPHTIGFAYDTIAQLIDAGANQVNIHLLYDGQNDDFKDAVFTKMVMDDMASVPALEGVKALVLLGLKPEGRARGARPASYAFFSEMVDYAIERDIPIGFDSCSAPKFERYVKEGDFSDERKKDILEQCESCESGLFSMYIDVNGLAYPCSFCPSGMEPIADMLSIDSFTDEVWHSEGMKWWRGRLWNAMDGETRLCVMFPEIN
jgi:MoaA/NifB/PqqE/SkfB family radical SAM enzyme